MKRWIWVLVMAPVMWGLFNLAIWADRLHAWHYPPPKYPPPTAVDYTHAAVVFWGALLIPVVVGLATAVVAFRRKYPARWQIGEMVIVATPYLAMYWGLLFHLQEKTRWGDNFMWSVFNSIYFLVGGIIVMSLLNLGACVQHRKWGIFVLSTLVFCGGLLHTLWMYLVIIYLDT